MKQSMWMLLICSIGMTIEDKLTELCSVLQNEPQALTVNGSTLYIMINSKIYSILLTTNSIHSSGRLALFNATNHGVWTSVPWLKAVAGILGVGGWNSLSQLNLIPSKAHNFGLKKLFLYAVYKTSPDKTKHCMFELLPDGKESNVSDIGKYKSRFAVFGDGSGDGYVVRRGEQNLVVFAPEPVAKIGPFNVSTFPSFPFSRYSDYGSFYFANISSPGHLTMKKVTNTPSSTFLYQPLVSNPDKALGFLFNGIIHYWDLETKQVVLFQDPLNELTLTVALKRVPMTKYFVCSSMAWSKLDSEGSNSEDNIVATTVSSSAIAWILFTICGVAGVLFLSWCIYFLALKFKSLKKYKSGHQKTSKSVSVSSSTSKSPSNSPTLKSRSPRKSTKSSIAAFKDLKNKKFLESQYLGTSGIHSTAITSTFGEEEIVTQKTELDDLSMDHNSGTDVNHNPFRFASGAFTDRQPSVVPSETDDDWAFVEIGQTNSGVKKPAKFPVPSLLPSTTGPTSSMVTSETAVSNKPQNQSASSIPVGKSSPGKSRALTVSSTHIGKMIHGKSSLPSTAPVSRTTSQALTTPLSASYLPQDNGRSITPKGKKDSDSKIPSTRN